jgi:hypothetical protein
LTGSTHSYQKLFAEKLLAEYKSGRVEEAVMLSLGNPSSVWFQPFFEFLLCFNRKTSHFKRADGSTASFGFPLALVYLGPQEKEQTFIEEFKQFGRIVRAVD